MQEHQKKSAVAVAADAKYLLHLAGPCTGMVAVAIALFQMFYTAGFQWSSLSDFQRGMLVLCAFVGYGCYEWWHGIRDRRNR